jgi:molybdopterin-guanine dinucleotide biosynthesis protein A
MLAAAILAGGQASRLGGRVKALLPLGEGRIIDLQIAALGRVADDVFIVANEPALYAEFGLPIVGDRVSGAGAIAGLHAALGASPAPRTLVVACDLPFITEAFARALATAGCEVDVALPRTADGLHPLCACWASTAVPVLERQMAAGRRRVIDALTALRVRELTPEEVAGFDPDGRLLFNVNTPDEYARALQMVDRPDRRGCP